MKEIKAFVHRSSVGHIVHALIDAGFDRLSVTDVRGTLAALSQSEEAFSVELGEKMIVEARIEVVCEDGRLEEALDLIEQHGAAGRTISGWLFISPVDEARVIAGRGKRD